MKKDQQLPILFEARTPDSVETLHITATFVRAGKSFLEVGPAFMAAHEELGINLKFDRATNRGWVTSAEADAIIANIAAAL